jgi:hypothetical protein
MTGYAIMGKAAQSQLTFNWKHFWWRLFISIVVILIFIYYFYGYLNDHFFIQDGFFLKSFSTRMVWYASFGYLIASICFALFLYAANEFDILDDTKLPDDQQVATALIKIDDKGSTKTEKYDQLESLFESAFIGSSLILSVFVLWVGVLFNAINSTDVLKYYKAISGSRPFLNDDFVYLIGLFHTLLLLIFYTPIKLKFNSLASVRQVNQNKNDDSKKFLRFLSDSLPTILVTASPILTGLIQKLINVFAGS